MKARLATAFVVRVLQAGDEGSPSEGFSLDLARARL
ncbi:hypothetical protein A2U01_0077419, partial [Trifolium medium]|nr:hypothetical protein [Trifolium medium]